jgi:hypothetical protein
MACKTPLLHLYLDSFKRAAREGAALELKMRLLAGKIPALQKYAHQRKLGKIETDLVTHFASSLSKPKRKPFACPSSFEIKCFTAISAQRGRNCNNWESKQNRVE